jgi:hypothetical protein
MTSIKSKHGMSAIKGACLGAHHHLHLRPGISGLTGPASNSLEQTATTYAPQH